MIRRLIRTVPSTGRAGATLVLAVSLGALSLRLETSTPSIWIWVLGLVLSAASLTGAPVQTAAIACFLAAYLVALLSSDVGLDAGAPLVGVLVYLLGESLQHDGSTPELISPVAARGRVWSLIAVSGAGFTLASLVLVLATGAGMSGPLAVAAGGVVAVALIGSVLWVTKPLLAPDHPAGQDR